MYQALYRKWRPRLFDDVVGQSHITRTLKRQVMSGHLSHAYLFTGTRGTGKTTCAKLLARAVNCEHPVEGNPCGQCAACRGIEDGSILDVVELDAASNNGVDQVRALREEAVYAPAAVKRRVYIVDEVHMLSTGAFNALLKILEEPPEHVLFILATTELHKVPATILSRCQRFSFKRIQASDIQNRLLYIANAEGIPLTEDGAALLARLSDGALRDALSLLDQCAVGEGTVDREAVQNALGLAGNTKTAHIMNHIRRGETAQALTLLSELYAAGKDVSSVLSELSGLTRDLLLRSTTGGDAPGLMAGGYDEATLNYLAKGMSPQRLLHILTVLQDAQARLKTSADRRTEAELCLIRLCDRRLDGSVLSLSQRLSRLEAALSAGARPVAGQGAANVPPFDPGAGEDDEPLPAGMREETPPPFGLIPVQGRQENAADAAAEKKTVSAQEEDPSDAVAATSPYQGRQEDAADAAAEKKTVSAQEEDPSDAVAATSSYQGRQEDAADAAAEEKSASTQEEEPSGAAASTSSYQGRQEDAADAAAVQKAAPGQPPSSAPQPQPDPVPQERSEMAPGSETAPPQPPDSGDIPLPGEEMVPPPEEYPFPGEETLQGSAPPPEEYPFPPEEVPPVEFPPVEEGLAPARAFPAQDAAPVSAPAEQNPFPARETVREEPVPWHNTRGQRSSTPNRRTPMRKKVPPQEGGDAWFWEQLVPALAETMGQTSRAMVEMGLVKGQYWPGLLRLYVNSPWAESWMSHPERREQVERCASMQAGQHVRVEVIQGAAPKARQPMDPALSAAERGEPERSDEGTGAAAGPEENFRDFLELAKGQDFVEFVED